MFKVGDQVVVKTTFRRGKITGFLNPKTGEESPNQDKDYICAFIDLNSYNFRTIVPIHKLEKTTKLNCKHNMEISVSPNEVEFLVSTCLKENKNDLADQFMIIKRKVLQ